MTMKKIKSDNMFDVILHHRPKLLSDENLQEYVILSAEEYNNLEAIRKMKSFELYGVSLKMIKFDTLLFLNTVMQLLETVEIKEFSVIGDVCIMKLETETGIIDTCFSTNLCEKYYGKPLKFIEEVI